MKILFSFFCLILILSGCTSSNTSTGKEPIDLQKLPTRVKSRVEIKNDDGTVTPIVVPGSEETTIFDPKTGKTYKSEGWVDSLKYGKIDGLNLRGLTSEQIIMRLKSASPYETTLIIEELKSRQMKGVKALAHILDDSRVAVFPKGHEYWWYEKKDEPGEPVELRTYAALTLQFILNKFPSGVVMNMTKERLIFAVKDKHAVVKEDLITVWKDWWLQSKNEY